MEEESLSCLNKVPNKKSYMTGVIFFVVAGLFFLFSLFSLVWVLVSPQKFTIFFTISMICCLTGLAYMNGTQTYLKKLTIKKNRIASSVLLASIVLSLYFSLIKSSYFFSLLFCFI
jgi:hypothetical protein